MKTAERVPVTGALGTQDGERAVSSAAFAGLPVALPLWCDLEEPEATTTHDAVSTYARHWCLPVASRGPEASARVYVGAGVPCDGQQLYHLAFTGYWQSFSNVPTPFRRGYQMRQIYAAPSGSCRVRDVFSAASALVGDLMIDVDVTESDFLGSRPKMLIAE